MQETRVHPCVGKIPWRRKWQPTPVFLAGESHGQRSLAGYIHRTPKTGAWEGGLALTGCHTLTCHSSSLSHILHLSDVCLGGPPGQGGPDRPLGLRARVPEPSVICSIPTPSAPPAAPTLPGLPRSAAAASGAGSQPPHLLPGLLRPPLGGPGAHAQWGEPGTSSEQPVETGGLRAGGGFHRSLSVGTR